MVVDILETKLDDDYIEYISGMILKNATSSDDNAQNITTQDVQVSTAIKETVNTEKNKDLPENWSPMDKKKSYEVFELEAETTEYIEVALKFHETLKFPDFDIKKVSRIQNPILWQYYSVKRSEMIQENEGIDVEERCLFHGTQTSVVDSICKKGFDWRVCGKNGTVYGQGSYFAVNASYSHQYTDKGQRRSQQPRARLNNILAGPPPAHTGSPSRLAARRMAHMQFLQQSQLSFSQMPGQMFSGMGGNIPPPNRPPAAFSVIIAPPSSASSLPIRPSGSQQANSVIQIGSQPTVLNAPQSQQPNYIIQGGPHQLYGQPQVIFSPLATQEERKTTHKMILSRVLVGRYTGGNATLRKPPPLFPDEDVYGKCYDSCVDHIHEPKIFVIFDSAQAYPEYLIEYIFNE